MLFDLFQLFFPKYCLNCERTLLKKEPILCLECYEKLPFRSSSNHEELRQDLSCFFKIEEAYSLLYFKNQHITSSLIHALKYKNKPQAGYALGVLLGKKMPACFDVVVPIPLHPKKQRKRGYNQSEKIVEGISEVLNIPMDTKNLIRIKNNPPQALSKNHAERLQNTLNIFKVVNPLCFENKHILLVDDIITTGSTVYNSASPLLKLKNVKISVACIGFAG
ncbi:MAG: ComF family protein [Flavobacteriales bacterium]